MEIVSLSKILELIDKLPNYPKEIHQLNKNLKAGNTDFSQVISYITSNKVFSEIFKNFIPESRRSENFEENISHTIKKLGINNLRNILYTCSILALNKNENTAIVLKKIITAANISKDIIEKINLFRKTKHNPENFYLYSLFHDIGEVFATRYFNEELNNTVFNINESIDLDNINEIVHHNEIGYMMINKWELPSIFSYICLNHTKLEYRKFTADFIFIINVLAVADALALEILDFKKPIINNWDVGHSIYKIGLREDDVYTEAGIIGTVDTKIPKILSLYNLK
ncbi:MAG: HDOD domain-containing protein [Candidatus Delongbacteria bacterium]|nr:HDOD domain-containing protein [Candidatus Delongbacteria bacterium]